MSLKQLIWNYLHGSTLKTPPKSGLKNIVYFTTAFYRLIIVVEGDTEVDVEI